MERAELESVMAKELQAFGHRRTSSMQTADNNKGGLSKKEACLKELGRREHVKFLDWLHLDAIIRYDDRQQIIPEKEETFEALKLV